MVQLNRRKFLYSSVAVSAATALAPYLLAASTDEAWQPSNPVSQEACKGSSVQPNFGGDRNFVNWRQQGACFGKRAVRNRQFPR
jgi:hypothetical protein